MPDANSAITPNSGVTPNDFLELEVGTERLRETATILLVEDETLVRDVTHEVLESAGYSVVPAKDAKEALELGEHLGHVDLLLTDIVLPGRSGRALAAMLRTLQPNVFVLFMSGYPAQLAEVQAAEPSQACLPKPFSAAALLRRVDQVLHGKAGPRTESSNPNANSLTRVYENG